MCGIIAVAAPPDRQVRFDLLHAQLLREIAHRGPDHSGQFYDVRHNTFIGHSLLRTTSLSVPDSTQPWSDQDCVIAFNGEIYNHRAIRAELEALGEKFKTDTDTEVLVKGYLRMGVSILKQIEGCWAFAILDKQRGVLHFGRDPLGEKQLSYGFHEGFFALGSEAKSVLHALGLRPRTNDRRIYADLIFDFFADREHTYFQNVVNCAPGYAYSVNLHNLELLKLKISNYQIECARPTNLEVSFLDSLDKMLPRVFEPCIILSGGFDSSTVAAGLRRLCPGKKFDAFTVRYGNECTQDYLYAKKVAEELGNFDLHEVNVDAGLYERLHDEIAFKLEEPVYDHVFLAQYLLYAAVREKGYRIAYNGQGSDEFWGGYVDHYDLKNLYTTPSLEAHASHFKEISINRGLQFLLDHREITDLIESGLHSKWSSHGPLGKILFEGHLQAMLTHEDRMSMASSVVVRLPFLNRSFLSHSFDASPQETAAFGIDKHQLRAGLGALTPRACASRKKQAFPDAPSSHYTYLETFSESYGDSGFFGTNTLRALKNHCHESFKKALCVNEFERVLCR